MIINFIKWWFSKKGYTESMEKSREETPVMFEFDKFDVTSIERAEHDAKNEHTIVCYGPTHTNFLLYCSRAQHRRLVESYENWKKTSTPNKKKV